MTTSSTNFTGLYSGGTTTPIPNSAYGNANVVSLLAAGTDGGNTVGNVVAAGNITADYFIGDGSLLTNINAGNIVGAYGNANVAAFLPTYTGDITANNVSVSNTISATGNVITDSFFVGNFVGNVTGNITVPGLTTEVLYNNAGNVGASPNFKFDATTNAFSVLGTASVTGNITGGNINTAGNVSAVGMVAGNIVANNITAYGSGGNIFALANICAIGNIDTPQAVNAVTVSATGNVNSDAMSVSTLITGGSINSLNTIGAVGNITTSAYFVGDGSKISNISAANVNGNVTQATNALTVRFSVKNNTGSTIAKGVPVYATGTVGATTTIEVAPSRADTASTMAAIGLLESALTAGSTGYAVSIGELTSIDTSTYTVGTELYVAATGGLTDSRPTGSNVIQTVGTVGRVNASTGSMLVNIWDKNPLPNLGSGNVWVGNVNGYPTETPYGVFSGNLSIGNLLASDVVYANTIQDNGNSNLTLSSLGTSSASLANINLYTDYLSVGNIDDANPNPFISGVKASSYMRIYSGNTTSPGPGITMTPGANNIELEATGGNVILDTNVLSMTGTVISAATANITANVYFGNGSGLTNVSAVATPAGSNTQIQYNDAGSLGAVPTLTYDNITGNITGGNIVTNGSIIKSVNAWDANTIPQAARITIGTGYNGDYSSNYDSTSITRGSQFAVINKQLIGNADTNQSLRLTTSMLYTDLGGATLTNNNRRLFAGSFINQMGNGTQNMTLNPYLGASGSSGGLILGNTGNATIGNITLGHGAAQLNSMVFGAGATVGNAVASLATTTTLSATGTVTNSMGMGVNFTTAATPGTYPTKVYGYYMAGATNNHGITSSTAYRSATNYYFLYNDDAVAQTRLGTLRYYNEFKFVHGTTSGDLTINKEDAQVQQVDLAGSITSITFSNFVTALSDGTNTDQESDTVTVILNQGSTGGYAVSFPSGSTYKYAGGINTLSTTAANSVTLMTITAVRLDGSNVTYLITLSPGFV